MLRRTAGRLKGLPIFIAVAGLLGFVIGGVGGLLSGGSFPWNQLFTAIPAAIATALFIALIRGRSAGVFTIAVLCVVAATIAYMVFVGPGLLVGVLGFCLVVVILGTALSGREQGQTPAERIVALGRGGRSYTNRTRRTHHGEPR